MQLVLGCGASVSHKTQFNLACGFPPDIGLLFEGISVSFVSEWLCMQLVGDTTCLPLRVGQNLVDSLLKAFSAAEPRCRGGTFEFCSTECEAAEKKYFTALEGGSLGS